MSLETAMAALEKSNQANPLNPTPGVDPDKSVPVKKESEVEIDLKNSDGSRIGEEKKPEDSKTKEEKPTEEKKPEVKEQESKRFAILAKKEKAIQTKVLEVKQKEESINQRLGAIENFEKFKREVKNNPMLALEELGITYNQLTEYVLQGKMPNKAELEYAELRQELASIKQEREDERKKATEDSKKANEVNVQQTISEFQVEIGDYIKKNAEKYELITQYDTANLVFQTIEKQFAEEKRLLTIEEASDLVEKYLEEQVEKAISTKKFKARVQPQSPKEDVKQKPSSQQQSAQLTNQMTSSAPSFLPAKTDQDRINRALAALSKN